MLKLINHLHNPLQLLQPCRLVVLIATHLGLGGKILTADLEKRKQTFEMRRYRRLLNISYKEHVTNEKVRRKQPLENMTNS